MSVKIKTIAFGDELFAYQGTQNTKSLKDIIKDIPVVQKKNALSKMVKWPFKFLT